MNGGEMVLGRDNMYSFGNGTATLDAKNTHGAFNFNEAQISFRYPAYADGDTTKISLKDKNGKEIMSIIMEWDGEFVYIKHAVSGQVLIIVPADPTKDMTVRLEYHYDLEAPTLDIIVRYVDRPTGHSLVKPASLKGVPVTEEGAKADEYSSVEITTEADEVYIDDAYVRNVRTNF